MIKLFVMPKCWLVPSMVGVFVFITTTEAMLWPIKLGLGQHPEWWQIKWLAVLGFFLGCVPLVLGGLFSIGQSPAISFLVFFLFSIAWAFLISISLHRVIHAIYKARSRA